MSDKRSILVIDDDPSFCTLIKSFLEKNDFAVAEAHDAREGLRSVYDETYDLVLIDYRLPDLDGLELLKNIKKKYFHLPVIIMTNYANIRTAVTAMKLGAFEYVTKPVNPDEILITIGNALNATQDEDHGVEVKQQPRKQTSAPALMFVEGKSKRAKEVKKHIELVAPTNLSVIVEGESGTGKEYVSRHIHHQSDRKDKPFVALDCGALSDDLAGSELFGHLKGAFTGALQDKEGQFVAANGGTLFLDEIGNLSYEIQVKLLRAIQERTVRQIGSNKNIKVDVRLIVATNENLEQAVQRGEFREDLFHRLNEFQIKVPALRERADDIHLFVNHFLSQSNRELKREVESIAPDVMLRLQEYHWPGNIRELKNVIRRAVLLSQGKTIEVDALPAEIASPVSSQLNRNEGNSTPQQNSPDLKAIQENTERALIEETLVKVKYNKTLAAKMLNIDRKTLYNKLKRYNLD